MAFFGLSKPWVANIDPITGDYTGAINVGKAIGTNVTPNYSTAELYGNNKLAEKVSEFVNATVTLNVTTMPAEAVPMLFGHTVDEDGTETSNSEDSSPFVGYAFLTAEVVGRVKKYRACLLKKVQFTEGEEGYQTKGDQINFVTPNLNGTAIADDDGEWRVKSPAYATETLADAWARTQLNGVHTYTETELNKMGNTEIQALAGILGYTVTGDTKAELITSFLEAQDG